MLIPNDRTLGKEAWKHLHRCERIAMAATADLRERAMREFVLYGNTSISESDLRMALGKHLAKLSPNARISRGFAVEKRRQIRRLDAMVR